MRSESVEAALCLVWARVNLRRGAREAIRGRERAGYSSEQPSPGELATAIDLGKITMDVADRLPWTSNCLVRSVALATMLGRRKVPVEVRFGVRRDTESGAIAAHAWVASGDHVVLDSDLQEGYTVFERSPRGGDH